jgi:hypothetical protein
MTIVLLLSVALVLVLLLLPLLLVVAGVGLFAALIAGVIGVELLRGLPEPVFRELRQGLEELRQELKDLSTEAAREYWREQEEGTARARALLGGWCRAHCGTPWASGGLLSCDCGCGEPKARKLPKVEAERLRAAEEFVKWAQAHSSPQIRQLGALAAAVLQAYRRQDAPAYAQAEEAFWQHWIGLSSDDWDAVERWRREHVPLRWGGRSFSIEVDS